MSTPAPALPSLPWLPGLSGIDRSRLEIVIGEQRFPGQKLESRRLILAQGDDGSARLAGDTLHLTVGPNDAEWALALAAAFASPDRPAAADPAATALLALAARVGASPASVLIEGATGTGKEGLARLVHSASPRRNAPLVAVSHAGVFVRRTDPMDARRAFIGLSDEAFDAVVAWLRRFAAAFQLR